MIRIVIGNVGSGKTLSIVRELMLNPSQRVTYTNIETKKIPNTKLITPEMLIKKEQIGEKRDGTPTYKMELNVEFWKNLPDKHINVVIDEAHTLVNARKAMSKVNILMGDWLALIRRILGQSPAGYGELTLITQLINRVDIIAREMATNVRFVVGHFDKHCKHCGYSWKETSETPEPHHACPQCTWYNIERKNFSIEIWHFSNITNYLNFKEFGMHTYHRHYIIRDVEQYFKHYNTVQWNSLLSELY